MNCRTVRCETPFSDQETDRQFCERCGWMLPFGRVLVEPDRLRFRGSQTQKLTLRVANSSVGSLKWEVRRDLLPPGVSFDGECGPAKAFGAVTAVLTVDPAPLLVSGELEIPVRLWDAVGGYEEVFRQREPQECYRDITVTAPYVKQVVGPVLAPQRTLFFGGNVRSAPIKIWNKGISEVSIQCKAPSGFRFQAPLTPPSESIRITIPPETAETLTVRQEISTAPAGQLTLTPDELGPFSIDLLPVKIAPMEPPDVQWVIAVDFGTSKSVVMILNQHELDEAKPNPVMWPDPGSSELSPIMPSVVELHEGKPVEFGFLARKPQNPNEKLLRRLKMHLRNEDEEINRAVAFCIEELLDGALRQIPEIDFNNALAVFTLPVLDDAEEAEKQRRLTLDAALKAGIRFGLTKEKMRFYYEPECAAVDFIYLAQPTLGDVPAFTDPTDAAPLSFASGDWICVLDMGGGTTDVTFAKYTLSQEGVPSFDEIHSIGFPNFAGDRIDDELYRWAVNRWIETGRIKEIRDKDGTLINNGKIELGPAFGAKTLILEDERYPVEREMALLGIRQCKEAMYRQIPPQTTIWDEFTNQANFITFDPDEISKNVLSQLARIIISEGFTDTNGKKYPSIRDLFRSLNINASQVKLLCLTGGTSLIPDFAKALQDRVLTSPIMRKLLFPELIRLNVARGAALRPGMKIRGRLPFDVTLEWDSMPGSSRLNHGASPGTLCKESHYVPSDATTTVTVNVAFPGEASRAAYQWEARNHSPQNRYLQAEMEFTSQRLLRIRLDWQSGDARQELDWQTIQWVPTD